MKYSLFDRSDSQAVIDLFVGVFSASEGEMEGRSIGDLVTNLITKTQPADLIGCVVKDDDCIIGCVYFSRFSIPTDQTAFILSPLAVATRHQGAGIGQHLIAYGLNHLKGLGVQLVFTYGDPDFYAKTGFKYVGEHGVKAPYPLSQPEGWLVLSMTTVPAPTIQGATQCVPALSDPRYW